MPTYEYGYLRFKNNEILHDDDNSQHFRGAYVCRDDSMLFIYIERESLEQLYEVDSLLSP
jgi:predicted RNA-binding protein YlxR (DUF448 family)